MPTPLPERRAYADPPTITGSTRLMSHATASAIRHALRALGNERVEDARLRRAAAAACEDARTAGLRVEQMLVAIKEDWAAHPEVCRLPHGRTRSDVTNRFITLCIRQYYADTAPHRDTGQDSSLAIDGAR